MLLWIWPCETLWDHLIAYEGPAQGLCEEELTLEEGRGSRDWPHHDLCLFLQVSVLLFETQPKKPAPSIRSSTKTWHGPNMGLTMWQKL